MRTKTHYTDSIKAIEKEIANRREARSKAESKREQIMAEIEWLKRELQVLDATRTNLKKLQADRHPQPAAQEVKTVGETFQADIEAQY